MSTSDELIDKVWKSLPPVETVKSTPSTPTTPNATRSNVVRVFVSSTFRDFFSERDWLVRRVFSDLQEWCRDRKLRLVECDLRWGVPEDSTTRETLLACLEEIDRCIAADGCPFFICLLSQRYGWIPDINSIDEDIVERYQWIEGLSITHMEIAQAALRMKNPNALFAIRSDSFLSGLDEKTRQFWFCDDDDYSKLALSRLKDELRNRYPEQCFDYDAVYSSVDDPNKKRPVPVLSGLDAFAQRITDFLKQRIKSVFSSCSRTDALTPTTKANPLEMETVLQELALTDLVQTKLKRDIELEKLRQFVVSSVLPLTDNNNGNNEAAVSTPSSTADLEFLHKLKDWGLSESMLSSEHRYLALAGSAGDDRSHLLAQLIRSQKASETFVFYHLFGCNGIDSARTGDERCWSSFWKMHCLVHVLEDFLVVVLRSVGLSLPVEFDLVEIAQWTFPQCVTKLKQLVALMAAHQIDDDLPANVEKDSSPLALVVFGNVEYSSDERSVCHLDWLPAALRCTAIRFRVIISFNESFLPTTARLRRLRCYFYRLPSISQADRIQFISDYFADFNKKLSKSQLDGLVENKGADSFLWLKLVCDDLRTFGHFRQVLARIQAYPDRVDELVKQIASRVVSEDGQKTSLHVLQLLVCEREGLLETDLLHLLAALNGNEPDAPIPYAYWAHARRAFRPLLSFHSFSGGTLIKLASYEIFQAIAELAFSPDESPIQRSNIHNCLATFYQERLKHSRANWILMSVVRQYRLARNNEQLTKFLRHSPLVPIINPLLRAHVLNEMRCKCHVSVTGNPSLYLAVFTCMACANKPRLVSPLNHLTKHSCYICGAMLLSGGGVGSAYFCAKHRHGHEAGKSQIRCICCSFVQNERTAVPLKLCSQCQPAGTFIRCAAFE